MTDSLIYGLAHAEEIRYVGQTTLDPAYRLRCHLNAAKRADQYVARWIRSVDYDVQMVVLEQDPADLAEAERDWITTLRTLFDCRLTNLSEGGESGAQGYIWTDEQRAAHRERMKDVNARPAKREASAKGGRQLLGRSPSLETREKIAATLTGRKNAAPSEATRDKIGRANTGSKCSCRASRPCAFCRRGGDCRA